MKSSRCYVWRLGRNCKLYRQTAILLFAIVAVVLLTKWKLFCTNLHPKSHIENICASYEKEQSNGNLCETLCETKTSSVSCINLFVEKGAVLSGIWMNQSIVFKSVDAYNDGNDNLLTGSRELSESNFVDNIKKVVKTKFNLAIESADVERLTYQGNPIIDRDQEIRWSLLNDNEYLALALFDKYNVFPKLIGTCGSLYAVQRLNSIYGYKHLVSLYDSQADWVKRVKISVMIMDFLIKLEEMFPEPMHICDIKMNNFVITNDLKKVKYIDLESIHPLSVANKIIATRSNCNVHSDCDLSDCRSFCNLITFKCQHGVVNNNLQIVCEKIFLGWMMSGRIMVSGLLIGSRTPDILVEILEECANPYNEKGTPRAQATKQIRKRLYNFLVHFM